MVLIESGVLSEVGTSLATGIVKQAGARLASKLRKPETAKALERCGQAAVEALVEEGFPEGTEIPRDHLEGVLGGFAEDEVVHDVLAGAIRGGSLPPDELSELRERFEEAHPPETLPGFDEERGIAAFVTAFVEQADEEAELQGLIQTKELRAQTRHLREQLAGLDEVPEAENRRVQLRAVVESFAGVFPKCRILVTSRIYAYQDQDWRLDGFREATLAPFSRGQIRRFIGRWYDAVARRRGLRRKTPGARPPSWSAPSSAAPASGSSPSDPSSLRSWPASTPGGAAPSRRSGSASTRTPWTSSSPTGRASGWSTVRTAR